MLQHKHLIVRAEIESPPFETGPVEDWLRKLISDLGMNVLYGPFAMYCDLEHNEGMTAGCILSTSHCVLHTWDKCEPAILQLDLYTCSDLDPAMIHEAIEIFKPTKIEQKFLDREHGLVEITS
jgi:S-adenosylmethionine/arginine decarboxylase-like enzyme